MGYYYQSRKSDIKILKEQQDLVFVAVRRELAASKQGGIDFSDVLKTIDLPALLRMVGIEVKTEKNGDIIGLKMNNQKFSSDYDKAIYGALAKAGVTGSIEFVGEDSSMWRYLLKDGKMIEQAPKQIIWG